MTIKNAIVRNGLSSLATTLVAVGSVYAWNGLTASNGDTLDATKWNQLVSAAVPSGAVMAFNLGSCPTGWAAINMAGRTVIAAGNGAGSTTAVGDLGGDKSSPSLAGTTVNTTLAVSTSTATSLAPAVWSYLAMSPSALVTAAMIYIGSGSAWTTVNLGGVSSSVSGGGTAPDNMQPYIAFLYCQKN